MSVARIRATSRSQARTAERQRLHELIGRQTDVRRRIAAVEAAQVAARDQLYHQLKPAAEQALANIELAWKAAADAKVAAVLGEPPKRTLSIAAALEASTAAAAEVEAAQSALEILSKQARQLVEERQRTDENIKLAVNGVLAASTVTFSADAQLLIRKAMTLLQIAHLSVLSSPGSADGGRPALPYVEPDRPVVSAWIEAKNALSSNADAELPEI
jgi:hypothetical protein